MYDLFRQTLSLIAFLSFNCQCSFQDINLITFVFARHLVGAATGIILFALGFLNIAGILYDIRILFFVVSVHLGLLFRD